MRVGLSGQLSPYDGLTKKYASQYGQDWRLITAQMYQESRFDPEAVSWGRRAGADAGDAEHRAGFGFYQSS